MLKLNVYLKDRNYPPTLLKPNGDSLKIRKFQKQIFLFSIFPKQPTKCCPNINSKGLKWVKSKKKKGIFLYELGAIEHNMPFLGQHFPEVSVYHSFYWLHYVLVGLLNY